MIKTLIVEDEHPISDLIKMNLSQAGHNCFCCYDGLEAANRIEKENFDLIILDIMLPKIDGYELMEYIRPLNIPVIFITAKHEVKDKVKGLKLGADDYISKPFEVVELLARVESVLRRYNKLDNIITIEDVSIDTNSRIVKKNNKKIILTLKEFELLILFIKNKNIALFRETLYEKVWDSDFLGDTRTVDIHVQRIRKKLSWENKICAVYKVGYRLEV